MNMRRRVDDPPVIGAQFGMIRWTIAAVKDLGIVNVIALALLGFIVYRQDNFVTKIAEVTAHLPAYADASGRAHDEVLKEIRSLREDSTRELRNLRMDMVAIQTNTCINEAGTQLEAKRRCFKRFDELRREFEKEFVEGKNP